MKHRALHRASVHVCRALSGQRSAHRLEMVPVQPGVFFPTASAQGQENAFLRWMAVAEELVTSNTKQKLVSWGKVKL